MADDWDRRDWTADEIARRSAQFRRPGWEGARDATPGESPTKLTPDEDVLVRSQDRPWAPATGVQSRPGVAVPDSGTVVPDAGTTGWVHLPRSADEPYAPMERSAPQAPCVPPSRATSGGGSSAAVVRGEVPRHRAPDRADEVVERRSSSVVVRRG